MSVKIFDTMTTATPNFPLAYAEKINVKLQDGTEDNLQNLFDNDSLIGGGGDSSVTLTQQEYEALTEEQKLDGLYYTYDTKRIYKNGVQYGASDAEGIGYNNAGSGIQATTVQGAIDNVVEKVDGLISDTTSSTTSTWSSQKTSSKIAEKIDKTDIATTLDNSATDDQVYSAKVVNTELDKICDNEILADANKPTSKICEANYSTLNTPAKEGLTAAEASLIISINGNETLNGQISISMAEPSIFVRSVGSDSTWTGWQRVLTNKSEPSTPVSLAGYANTTYITCFDQMNINVVKLGRQCQFNISGAIFVQELEGASNLIIMDNIPEEYRPVILTEITLYSTGSFNSCIRGFIDADGKLMIYSYYDASNTNANKKISGYLFGTTTYFTQV